MNIAKEMAALQGRVGMYYENMITGDVMKYHADDVFSPASVIKLPIFMAISKMAEEGKADFSEKLLIKNEEKMPSCGALNSFTNEPEVDIRTLCNLMITISDNTATNVLIDRFGTACYEVQFEEMGLHKTRVRRKLFDMEAAAKGLSNSVTPAEIGMLLKQIYERTFVNESVSAQIEDTLMKQQVRHKIPGYIGRKAKIANKTGEDDVITNDVAIVYAKRPFVLAFFSNDTDVPETERFLRQMALELYGINS